MARLSAGWVASVVVVCASVSRAVGCELQAPPLRASITAMPVTQALNQFRQLTELQWQAADEATVRMAQRPRSRRVAARTAAVAALHQLLQGTGLTFECLNERSFKVVLLPAAPPGLPASGVQEEELGEVTISALLVTGPRNRPVPQDTSAFSAPDFALSGIHGIDEIARLVPGVQFDQIASVSSSAVYTNFVIRGVTDRHGSTVGLWFDDIPLPSAASNTYARGFPYVFDLDRVEILRGPQPALLGANAQSGAIQFMPRQPGGRQADGMVRAELAATRGGDPSYELGAALGGPVSGPELGFRVSGWYRSEGGYVDRVDANDPDLPIVDRNANRTTAQSIRMALRYEPHAALTLTPALLYQSTHLHDSSAFNIYEIDNFPGGRLSAPAAGRFYNGSLIEQPFDDRFYLASLKAVLRFGSSELESVTGHFGRRGDMLSDDTQSLRWGGFGSPYGDAYPVEADDLITTHVLLQQRSFTQQLQLGSTGTGKRSWVVGGFYSYTRSGETDRVRTADRLPDTFTIVPELAGEQLDLTVPTVTDQSELAGFGLFRYQLLRRRLVLSAGVRVARLRLQTRSWPPLEFRGRRTETEVAPQYGISWDAGDAQRELTREFYFSAGEGYAPGNVDAARPTCNEAPIMYPTDTLWSYEAGIRQGWRRRAELDLNVFHVRWNNGPTAWRTCLFMHLPGRARSQGLGVKARLALGGGVEARVEAAYVDATYRSTHRRDDGRTVVHDVNPIPATAGQVVVSAGDAVGTPPQLAAPWTVTASLRKRFPLGAGRALTLFVEDSFHSRHRGPFYTGHADATYPSQLRPDPATNLLNVRTVLSLGRCDLSLFLNNVLDERPVLLKRNKGNDANTLYYATTFRPRTAGLSVNWRFGLP